MSHLQVRTMSNSQVRASRAASGTYLLNQRVSLAQTGEHNVRALSSCRDSSGGGAADGLVKEWILQDWSPGHGDAPMLLDTETGLVYTWEKVQERS
jgi:hypothetical protein